MPSQFGTIYPNAAPSVEDPQEAARKLQAIQALREIQRNSMVREGAPNGVAAQGYKAPDATGAVQNIDAQVAQQSAANPVNQNNWRQNDFKQLQQQLAAEHIARTLQDAQAQSPQGQANSQDDEDKAARLAEYARLNGNR